MKPIFYSCSVIFFVLIAFPTFAQKAKSGHVVAAVQNCTPHACLIFNANGESSLMDMKGKTLDKLTTGDSVLIKGQSYSIEEAPQLFITGGNLVSSGREQFAFIHIIQKTTQ